jgi:hypothetical protein
LVWMCLQLWRIDPIEKEIAWQPYNALNHRARFSCTIQRVAF